MLESDLSPLENFKLMVLSTIVSFFQKESFQFRFYMEFLSFEFFGNLSEKDDKVSNIEKTKPFFKWNLWSRFSIRKNRWWRKNKHFLSQLWSELIFSSSISIGGLWFVKTQKRYIFVIEWLPEVINNASIRVIKFFSEFVIRLKCWRSWFMITIFQMNHLKSQSGVNFCHAKLMYTYFQ